MPARPVGRALWHLSQPVPLLFAYGSLTVLDADARAWTLSGWRRCWGVAADNQVDLPGYRFWVDPHSGKRPEVHVAFLDLLADPAAEVNGTLFEVSADVWPALDDRERNYVRAVVGRAGEEDVWAYVGSAEGRERLQAGLAQRTAVIARSYRAAVLAGFEALGPGELERFEQLTDPEPCAAIALEPVLLA